MHIAWNMKPFLAALLLAVPMPSPARPPFGQAAPRAVVVEDADDDVVEIEAPDSPESPVPPRASIAPRAPLAPRVRVFARQGGSRLGIQILEITPDLRSHFGAPKESGVLVAAVEKDSQAAKAGVEVGDVLVSVDREKIGDVWEVSRFVERRHEGDSVKLDVICKGAAKTLTAKVERRTSDGEDEERAAFGRSFGRDFGRDIERNVERDLRRSLSDRSWGASAGSDRLAVLSGTQLRKLQERIHELERRLKDLEERMSR